MPEEDKSVCGDWVNRHQGSTWTGFKALGFPHIIPLRSSGHLLKRKTRKPRQDLAMLAPGRICQKRRFRSLGAVPADSTSPPRLLKDPFATPRIPHRTVRDRNPLPTKTYCLEICTSRFPQSLGSGFATGHAAVVVGSRPLNTPCYTTIVGKGGKCRGDDSDGGPPPNMLWGNPSLCVLDPRRGKVT